MNPGSANAAARPVPAHPRTEFLATFALAALAFIVVTGETTPIGLISDIAAGVGGTESQVGLTVSWYALVAGGTAVPLTRWTARFDRRWVLAASTAAFSVGHVASAVAGNLATLAVGRGLAAVGHGLFFALAAPTAQRLARPATRGRAAGRVMVGGAVALVVGTPLATGLGQLAGWRVALLAVAVVSRRAPGRAAEPANALYGIVFQIGIVSGSALGSWCYAAGSVTAIPLVAMSAGAVALALVTTWGRAFRAADPGA